MKKMCRVAMAEKKGNLFYTNSLSVTETNNILKTDKSMTAIPT